MYNEFAHLWPLISDPAGYAEEARYWREALRAELGPGRHHILELGVGGGNNLSHLTNDFQATAVDLSEGMLEHSRRLNPEVEHHVGDMRTVRLNRTFDAVIIHDAVSYLTTEEDIRATFQTARAHLEPGGVFIIAPDYTTESFLDDQLCHKTRSDGQITLSMIEYEYRPHPERSEYECLMIYFIREGNDLRVEQDRHVFGLFSRDRWCQLLNDAGFEVRMRPYDVHEDSREAFLFVGILK